MIPGTFEGALAPGFRVADISGSSDAAVADLVAGAGLNVFPSGTDAGATGADASTGAAIVSYTSPALLIPDIFELLFADGKLSSSSSCSSWRSWLSWI